MTFMTTFTIPLRKVIAVWDYGTSHIVTRMTANRGWAQVCGGNCAHAAMCSDIQHVQAASPEIDPKIVGCDVNVNNPLRKVFFHSPSCQSLQLDSSCRAISKLRI
jgi:hypothetical protein